MADNPGNILDARGTITIKFRADEVERGTRLIAQEVGRAKTSLTDLNGILKQVDRAAADGAKGFTTQASAAKQSASESARLAEIHARVAREMQASKAATEAAAKVDREFAQLQRQVARERDQAGAAASRAAREQVQASQQAGRAAAAQARESRQLLTAQVALDRATGNYTAALTRIDSALSTTSSNTAEYARLSALAARVTKEQEQAVERAAAAHRQLDTATETSGDGVGRFSGAVDTATGLLGTLGVSLGVAEIIQFGIGAARSANSLEDTNVSVKALAGSTEAYQKVLEGARAQQRLFGGTLESNIQQLGGLSNIARNTGLEIQELSDVASRLLVLDPSANFSDAAIALREAFSGDLTSLSERFELPKRELAAFKDESLSAADKLKVLDDFLTKVGITSKVVADRLTTDSQAFRDFGIAVGDATGRVGSDLSQTFAPLARLLTATFNQVGDAAKNAGVALNESTGLDEFNSKLQEINDKQLGPLVPKLQTLTQAQYDLARSLVASGTSAEDAYKRVTALGPSLQRAVDAFNENPQGLSSTIRDALPDLIKIATQSKESAGQVDLLLDVFGHTGDIEFFQEQLLDLVRAQKAQADQSAASAQYSSAYTSVLKEAGEQAGLTAEDLAKLVKEQEKITGDATAALEKVIFSEVGLFAERENRQQEHNERLAELTENYTDRLADLNEKLKQATTNKQREAIQEQIGELEKGYKDQQGVVEQGFKDQQDAAARAYAEAQAAQLKHLGGMLINYVENQIKSEKITVERGNTLISAIQQQYGILPTVAQQTFGAATGIIANFAADATVSASDVARAIYGTGEAAVDLQQKYERLKGKYVAELEAKRAAGSISVEEYDQQLKTLERRVVTEVLIQERVETVVENQVKSNRARERTADEVVTVTADTTSAAANIDKLVQKLDTLPSAHTLTLTDNATDTTVRIDTLNKTITGLPKESTITLLDNSGQTTTNMGAVASAVLTLPDGKQIALSSNADALISSMGDTRTAVLTLPDGKQIILNTNAGAVLAQFRDVTEVLNSIPANVTTNINARIDPMLRRQSPAPIEQVLSSVRAFERQPAQLRIDLPNSRTLIDTLKAVDQLRLTGSFARGSLPIGGSFGRDTLPIDGTFTDRRFSFAGRFDDRPGADAPMFRVDDPVGRSIGTLVSALDRSATEQRRAVDASATLSETLRRPQALPDEAAIRQLLRTGDFQGGIAGLQEDDPLISALLDLARQNKTENQAAVDEVIRLLQTGDFRGGIFGLAEDHPLITALLDERVRVAAPTGARTGRPVPPRGGARPDGDATYTLDPPTRDGIREINLLTGAVRDGTRQQERATRSTISLSDMLLRSTREQQELPRRLGDTLRQGQRLGIDGSFTSRFAFNGRFDEQAGTPRADGMIRLDDPIARSGIQFIDALGSAATKAAAATTEATDATAEAETQELSAAEATVQLTQAIVAATGPIGSLGQAVQDAIARIGGAAILPVGTGATYGTGRPVAPPLTIGGPSTPVAPPPMFATQPPAARGGAIGLSSGSGAPQQVTYEDNRHIEYKIDSALTYSKIKHDLQRDERNARSPYKGK